MPRYVHVEASAVNGWFRSVELRSEEAVFEATKTKVLAEVIGALQGCGVQIGVLQVYARYANNRTHKLAVSGLKRALIVRSREC